MSSKTTAGWIEWLNGVIRGLEPNYHDIGWLAADLENASNTEFPIPDKELRRDLAELLRMGELPARDLVKYIDGELEDRQPIKARLASRKKEVDNFTHTAVILQSYEPGRSDFYSEIACPACLWENVRPERVDRIYTGGSLSAKALACLDSANLFVACIDGTEVNLCNVFYELGYLGKSATPGILLTELETGDVRRSLFYLQDREILRIGTCRTDVYHTVQAVRETLHTILSDL